MIRLAAITFMGFALSGFGQAQIYQFTAPINGFQEVGASDLGNLGAGGFPGAGFYLNFGTLVETVYYDAAANTLRQVGCFTIATTAINLSFNETYIVSGSPVSASVSVDYTFNGGNNTISFDTGIQYLNADPTTQAGAGTSPGGFLNWVLPYTAACTFTTGGQDYYSSFAGTFGTSSGTTISTCVSQLTPASLIIEQDQDPFLGSPHPAASISAANGLTAFIANYVGDGVLYHQYGVPPTTAMAVPEPGNLMILSLVAFGLKSILRRRVRPWIGTARARTNAES